MAFLLGDRAIQCEGFRSGIFASPVVLCVFDRIRRGPIHWWWKNPFRRHRPDCYGCPKAGGKDATTFVESPCREFPSFAGIFVHSFRSYNTVYSLDLCLSSVLEPTRSAVRRRDPDPFVCRERLCFRQ